MFWSVAQCESQRERVAADFLKSGGFETYLPRIKFRRACINRIMPLFPGYLFVRIIDRWYPVNWTIGVVQLLMAGEHPAHVPDKDIRKIMTREVDGFVRLPKTGLRLGSSVRITKGALAGQLGVFDGMTGHERSRVLLELLGRKTSVELPAKDFVLIETNV